MQVGCPLEPARWEALDRPHSPAQGHYCTRTSAPTPTPSFLAAEPSRTAICNNPSDATNPTSPPDSTSFHFLLSAASLLPYFTLPLAPCTQSPGMLEIR